MSPRASLSAGLGFPGARWRGRTLVMLRLVEGSCTEREGVWLCRLSPCKFPRGPQGALQGQVVPICQRLVWMPLSRWLSRSVPDAGLQHTQASPVGTWLVLPRRAWGAGPAVGSDAGRGSWHEAGWGARQPETAAAPALVWPPSLPVGNHFTYPDASVQARCPRAALLSPAKPRSLTQIAFHASLIETVRWALPFCIFFFFCGDTDVLIPPRLSQQPAEINKMRLQL